MTSVRSRILRGAAMLMFAGSLLMPGLASADAALYDGLDVQNASGVQAPSTATPDASPVASPAVETPVTGYIIGDPDAPITLTMYLDYQCPHCRAYHTEIEPQLVEDFVRTGLVKLEIVDFPVIGLKMRDDYTDDTKESMQAAEAAMCAAEQDAFIPYRETLYSGELTPNSGTLNDDYLKSVAADLGLDQSAFDTCLDSGRYEERILAGFLDGVAANAEGTPSFRINGGDAFFLDNTGYDGLKMKLQDALDAAN